MSENSKSRFGESILEAEVEEWTDILRSAPSLERLRILLDERGFDVQRTLLAHFMEDEVENEYGVLVTPEKKIYRYTRSTRLTPSEVATFECVEMELSPTLVQNYPQVPAALKMIEYLIE